MNVVVAGKNNIAIHVLDELLKRSDISKIYVIFNSNDNGEDGFQRSFKKYCSYVEVEPISLEDAELLENSVFISLEFDRIIKPDRFKSKKLFNIHFSLLPKYKGMYTSAWPLLNGENETGVTLHEIDSGIDTGDIISQTVITISENDTAKDLYFKYIRYGTELVCNNLNEIISGEYISSKQKYYKSTYYSKTSIDYNSLTLDLKDTAFNIKRKVQAFTFRDYQLLNVLGYNVFGVKILERASGKKSGTILLDTERFFDISTVDYDIRLYKDRFDILLESCQNGNIELFIEVVNEFNINDKNSQGWSPIIVAAYNGNFHLVKALIELGADVNDVNNNGTSVLMYAKDYSWKYKDLTLFDYLINEGANISHKDLSNKKLSEYLTIEQRKFFSKFIA
ncbi:formyl transferase [Vibrio lentus]|nr:formyl transferase [Vibrio lentus]